VRTSSCVHTLLRFSFAWGVEDFQELCAEQSSRSARKADLKGCM